MLDGTSFLSFVIWISKFSVHRYLVFLEIISGLLILCLINQANLLIKEKDKLSRFITISTLIIVTLSPPNWGRANWSHNWFNVNLSNINITHESMVIMVGLAPISYVIPFFPEKVRFVRIYSNVSRKRGFIGSLNINSRGEKPLLLQKMVNAIEQHDGDIWVLSSSQSGVHLYDDILQQYHIIVDYNLCRSIETGIENLEICATY
jgi:hypothetical protein